MKKTPPTDEEILAFSKLKYTFIFIVFLAFVVWEVQDFAASFAAAEMTAYTTLRTVEERDDARVLRAIEQAKNATRTKFVVKTEPNPQQTTRDTDLTFTGNMAQTLESWQAAKIDRQGWDPSLWLVHEDANGLAGIVLCERWEEDTGYIDFLAVAPRVQGQGLGRAMLLHGLHALEDGGLARAELSVQGENASAISLYESVGMRSVATTERWEKPLRAM